MMRLLLITLLVVLLLIPLGLSAQEATDDNPPPTAAPAPTSTPIPAPTTDIIALATQMASQISDLRDEVTELTNQSLAAEALLSEARRYAQEAGSYLDIIETFSNNLGIMIAYIPIGVIIAGVIGFNELRRSHKRIARVRQQVEQELKDEALPLLKQEVESAIKIERIRSAQATQAVSLLLQGERQHRIKDFEGALAAYERACALDPDNPSIQYRLGYMQTWQDKLDDAKQHLEHALQIDKTFTPALANLGYVLRRQAEKLPQNSDKRAILLADAEQKLRQALSEAPKLVDEDGESWWGSLGGLYKRKGHITDAIKAYQRAQEATPLASYPVGNVALLHLMNGDLAQMETAYKQTEELAAQRVSIDGSDAWAWADLLAAQLALGKYDEAENTISRVLKLTSDSDSYVPNVLLDTLQTLAERLDEEQAKQIAPFIDQLRNRPSAQANT